MKATITSSRIIGSKDESKFILTDMNGRKICMGTYKKCDAAWAARLDQNHYASAGILWFLHEGQAYRMAGY